MSRQIYRQIGLIVALVVASVSLPIGIIGLTRESVITNNYYNTYNIYYNQTYYGGNDTDTEPEPYYAPETNTFYNLTENPDWFYDSVYNLTGDYRIYWYLNCSASVSFAVFICQDYMFDVWNENRTAHYYLIAHGMSISDGVASQSWMVESSDTWHFCWRYQHIGGSGVNVTIRTIINKV